MNNNAKLTAGELRFRGCYQGSNVSYNLKRLVEEGYINYEHSQVDRRTVYVTLSKKGIKAAKAVDNLYERQLDSIKDNGGIDYTMLISMNQTLKRLETFWINQILY